MSRRVNAIAGAIVAAIGITIGLAWFVRPGPNPHVARGDEIAQRHGDPDDRPRRNESSDDPGVAAPARRDEPDSPVSDTATVSPPEKPGRPRQGLASGLGEIDEDEITDTFAAMFAPRPPESSFTPKHPVEDAHALLQQELANPDPAWAASASADLTAAIATAASSRPGRDRVVGLACGRTVCEILAIGTLADAGPNGETMDDRLRRMMVEGRYGRAGFDDTATIQTANASGTAIYYAIYFVRSPMP